MSIKLLKDLNFAEKINSTEAITEAGKEILNNYRAYVYTNPASCGIVNGFVLEASKLSFDTGLMSILESVNKFINENNISWKLASACESISNNNSTYNYINKLGVQQVEKILEMDESNVISYIKAGALKNIQYIPEFRQVCKEVYKTNVTEAYTNQYTVTSPISYIIKEGEDVTFMINGTSYKISEGKVNQVKCDDQAFARYNKLLESFKRDENNNLIYEFRSTHGDLNKITIADKEIDENKFEKSITFEKGKINETFTESIKFREYANMLSKTMPIQEKMAFMNIASNCADLFENMENICVLNNVKLLNCANGTFVAITEAKDNVNVTVFHSVNAGSSCQNYEYMAEALKDVLKVSGINLNTMFEERINEDCKKMETPEAKEIREQLEANKEAQYDVRKKKIAQLAEAYKNDPVKIALLNKVAKDLAILEKQDTK